MTDKRAQWAKRIEAWRASGESVTGFCRTRGLNYPQFVYWQRALRSRSGVLVPVVVTSAMPSPSLIELVLPNGVQARCVTAADALALARGWSC